MSLASPFFILALHNLSTEKYIDLITKKILKLNKDNALALLNVGEEDLFVKYVESISEFESSEEILSVLVEDDILAKLTTTQVEGIINLNVLDYDCSIKLISNHNQKISLFAIEKADMTVRSYVLDNFFKLSDYTKLIYNFKNFDLWEEIIERLNSNLEDWSELNSNDLPMEFIDELLRNSNLAESRKLKLLESAITNKIHIKMWQKWIKSIDSIKEIHTVFDRKRPLIENSDQLLIANALDKAGLISISKSNNINFRPSRYNELQDGRK